MHRVLLTAVVVFGTLGCGPSQAELLKDYRKAKAAADTETNDVEALRVQYDAARQKAVKARLEALWNELPADHPEKKPGPRVDAHYVTEDISDTKQRFMNHQKPFDTAGTREHSEIEKKVLEFKQRYEEQKTQARRATKAMKKAEAALKK